MDRVSGTWDDSFDSENGWEPQPITFNPGTGVKRGRGRGFVPGSAGRGIGKWAAINNRQDDINPIGLSRLRITDDEIPCTEENLSNLKCLYCKDYGHFSHNCSNRKNKNDNNGWSRTSPRAQNWDNKPGNRNKDGDPPARQAHIPVDAGTEELYDNGISRGINFDRFEDIEVKVTGKDVMNHINSFEESQLHPIIVNNLAKSKYQKPTPVQKHALPNIMAGRDIIACAQTGSGKTAAFLIPIVHRLLQAGVRSERVRKRETQSPQAVIIAPTRELVHQIKEEARRFAVGSQLAAKNIYGGTSMDFQYTEIEKGCNILVATLGRLLHFVERGSISFSQVEVLVLDEADRMLDMGFKDEICKVMEDPLMPSRYNRQTLMFSATFPKEIQQIAWRYMKKDYLFVSVGIVGSACEDVKQHMHQVPQYDKREKLVAVLRELREVDEETKVIVFVETKKTADFLAGYISQLDLPSTSIHGDRYQREREEALADFKCGHKSILVATDVAARGLDIKNVEHVINYDLPKSIEDYVHRIGRTGRLGNTGNSITFYDPVSNCGLAAGLVKILADAQQTVPKWLADEASRNPHGLGGVNGRYGRNKSAFGGQDCRTEGNDNWDDDEWDNWGDGQTKDVEW